MTTNTGQTFSQILQKHCGSNLFLTGILLYATGNILTMLIGYGLLGIVPLLFLIPLIIGLLLVYLESKRKGEPRNTLRVLMFFKICTIIILALLFINIPFAISAISRGGNIAALSGFYSIVFSIPSIAFLLSLLRLIKGIRQGIKEDMQGKLRGVLPVSVFGFIVATLEFLHVGLFTRFAGGFVFQLIWLTQEVADFGLSPGAGFWFGIINTIGAIIFIVVLNRFNQDLNACCLPLTE